MYLAVRLRVVVPRGSEESPEEPMFLDWYREFLTRAFRACFGAAIGKSMKTSGAQKLWLATQNLNVIRRWGRWGDKSPVPGLHYVKPQSTLMRDMQQAWLAARID